MAFFLRPFGFYHTCIDWILRLNRSFADMAFFLCSLSFHYACIDWILWLNRSFADMAFFLCPFGRYNWRRAGLRGWLGIFFCPDSKNLWNWFFSDLAFNYSANFLSIYHTHFRQYGPLPILTSSQHLGLPFGQCRISLFDSFKWHRLSRDFQAWFFNLRKGWSDFWGHTRLCFHLWNTCTCFDRPFYRRFRFLHSLWLL